MLLHRFWNVENKESFVYHMFNNRCAALSNGLAPDMWKGSEIWAGIDTSLYHDTRHVSSGAPLVGRCHFVHQVV